MYVGYFVFPLIACSPITLMICCLHCNCKKSDIVIGYPAPPVVGVPVEQNFLIGDQMIIPDEKILFTSMTDFSFSKNICYKKFNKNINLFLEKYKIILKIFPIELSYEIMKHLDPRNNIHLFEKSKTCKGIRYLPCSRCFQKIVVQLVQFQ